MLPVMWAVPAPVQNPVLRPVLALGLLPTMDTGMKTLGCLFMESARVFPDSTS